MEEKTYKQMKHEFVMFYQNDVYPRLKEYNSIRQKGLKRAIAFKLAIFSFSVAIFLLFFHLLFLGGLFFFIFVASLLSMIIFCGLDKNGTIQIGYELDLKYPLMDKFVHIFFDNAKWGRNIKPPTQSKKNVSFEEKLFSQNLLNPFCYLLSDDKISGTFKGVNIFIYEADTSFLGNNFFFVIIFLITVLTLVTAGLFLAVLLLLSIIFIKKIYQYSPFRGVIVELDMNKNFNGHTIFHENSRIARKITPNKKIYKEIKLESVTFEQKYSVYSDDQIEARYLLTPAFMERIENLQFTFKAKYVRGSFKDNKLTLAIHTGKDMFAMGSDYKDSDSNTFAALYDEMISILQIIDELKLDQNTGL